MTEEEDPSSRLVRLLETEKNANAPTANRPATLDFKSQGAHVLEVDGGPSSPLDWVPPSADSQLAVKYIEQLPAAQQPITGSQAAADRKRALDRQVRISLYLTISIYLTILLYLRCLHMI